MGTTGTWGQCGDHRDHMETIWSGDHRDNTETTDMGVWGQHGDNVGTTGMTWG